MATRTHRLTLKPDLELIKSENISIAAMLTATDGSEWSYDVMKNLDDDWQLTLADLQAGEDYSLALQIRGETVKGRSLFLQPSPIVLIDRDLPEEVDEIELPVIEDIDPEIDDQIEDVVEEEPVEEEMIEIEDEMAGDLDELLPEPDDELLTGLASEVSSEQDENMISPAYKLAIGNGIILLFVGIGVVMWRRKSATTNPGDDL